MTKKTIKALKKIERYSPEEKVLAGAIGVTVFPFLVINELLKKPNYQLKPKKRRRRK